MVATTQALPSRQSRKHRNTKGIGWIVTALFIVGETAGGGLLALPRAVVNTGFFTGIALLVGGAAICLYTAILLAENWTILQQRWPEYRTHCRKPYPSMGLRAIGPRFGKFVSICVDITQFGNVVVFLVLSAKNIESMLRVYNIELSFCYLIVVVGVAMLPLTFLRSPMDFWWAAIAAMMTTSIAVCLILIGIVGDFSTCNGKNFYPAPTLPKIFMAYGTIVFSYGGHTAFPTIQHDMRTPYRFKISAFCAYALMASFYVPVSITGYLTYGGSLTDTVIRSIQNKVIQQIVNTLITVHIILAITIIFNPLNQEIEDLFRVPHEFGWKRVASRSFVMLTVIFCSLSVPNFGVLLDLVGGSTLTLMVLVFPCLFNLTLTTAAKKHNQHLATSEEKPATLAEVISSTSKPKLIINGFILLFAAIGGIAATYSALVALLQSEWAEPCYASLYKTLPPPPPRIGDDLATFACCGASNNISYLGIQTCLNPTFTIVGVGHG